LYVTGVQTCALPIYVVVGAAGIDPRMHPRGESVLYSHVGVRGAPDGYPAEQIEALASLEAAARRGYEPSVRRGGSTARADRMNARRLGGGGRRGAQLPPSTAGDPEQEEIQNGEEAELERDRDRFGIHLGVAGYCSMSK